jgi:transposase
MKKLRRESEPFKGLSIGLDLHKSFIQFSVLDGSGGEIDAGRIVSAAKELDGLMERLAMPGTPLQVAMEASGCFVWVFDRLAARLGRQAVHVAAPSKVKAIAQAGEKTDQTDAWWLADLLRVGRLPEAFVAEGDLRDLRVVSRELRSVVDARSDLMRRMKSHLAQLGMGFPASDWASVEGRSRIAALVARVRAEHGERGEAIGRLWSRIGAMDEEVDHWRERVKRIGKRFEQIKLIDEEMPGVGWQLAAVVWSELGDPGRYHDAKAYAKATGLTPGYRSSGGRAGKGKITREGSAHARWALTRAVVGAMRCRGGPGLAVKKWVQRMCRRKSKKAAMVAAARKLAEGIWRLFRLGEAFDLARAFPA